VVTDVLAETIQRCATEVVYACGPHPMLAAVADVCTVAKVPVQVAVEELMGCGYGVCMTCVIPMRRRLKKGESATEGIVYARSCTEGPVFNGANVIWNGAAGLPATPEGAELSPSGTAAGRGVTEEIATEHAPPGN
jgi:dihydroorotate dehydrogenase electron transfer subunit